MVNSSKNCVNERLLLYMYTNRKLQVKYGCKLSGQFGVLNGTKLCGVLSSVLFAVYIDGMLERLKDSGIGCYLSNSYVGGHAFADDVKMLSPTLSGMQLMYNICENYAEEYNIKFNGSKTCLHSWADNAKHLLTVYMLME